MPDPPARRLAPKLLDRFKIRNNSQFEHLDVNSLALHRHGQLLESLPGSAIPENFQPFPRHDGGVLGVPAD